MGSIEFLVFLIQFLNVVAEENDFKNCNKYTSFGHGYRDFFEVRENISEPGYVFYFEFFVRTPSDAHILLKNDITADQGVEIVIGGGSNTFSQIRLIQKDEKKTILTQQTLNIVNGLNFEKFHISIDKLGIIAVGKSDTTFLNWRFDNSLPIRYFAFGSWTNTIADWKFGCKNKNDMVQYEEEQTPLQRLRNDYLTFYDVFSFPNGKLPLQVSINFQIHGVNLNEKRGELTVHGTAILKWLDKKLKWKPEDYNGTKIMNLPPFRIWTPNLMVLNTLGLDRKPLFNYAVNKLMVTNDGSVFWRTPFKSLSSCTINLHDWPFDTHNCSVLVGFWMEPQNLILTLMDEYEMVSNYRGGSEWKILKAQPFNGHYNDDHENYGILYVKITRNRSSLSTILTSCYIGGLVVSAMSFWIPTHASSKFLFSCGGIIILLSMLFFAGLFIPSTYDAPRIISVYSWTVVIFCLPLIFFVLLKTIPESIKLNNFITKVLNSKMLETIFCLPQDSLKYGNLNEEFNKIHKNRILVLRLVTLLERLFFMIYLVALLVPHFIF